MNPSGGPPGLLPESHFFDLYTPPLAAKIQLYSVIQKPITRSINVRLYFIFISYVEEEELKYRSFLKTKSLRLLYLGTLSIDSV